MVGWRVENNRGEEEGRVKMGVSWKGMFPDCSFDTQKNRGVRKKGARHQNYRSYGDNDAKRRAV
jgi:hypothetical protein